MISTPTPSAITRRIMSWRWRSAPRPSPGPESAGCSSSSSRKATMSPEVAFGGQSMNPAAADPTSAPGQESAARPANG